jgi:hypothetical protein
MIFLTTLLPVGNSFVPLTSTLNRPLPQLFQATKDVTSTLTIQEATQILKDWDQHFNQENITGNSLPDEIERYREVVPLAVKLLSEAAREERTKDSTMGRVMLGICASSLEEGFDTLKSWVTGLSLPRGLLHGADKDGVQLEMIGLVYIKVRSFYSLQGRSCH